MTRSRIPLLMLVLFAAFASAGCGANYGMNSASTSSGATSSGTGAISVPITMTDTPPAGVTILSFEVNVTSATLNPGNVDLLAGKRAVRVEVRELETESAFLNTASIPPGTYTSLNLTFANPELTFQNNSGAPLAGCAAGAVCEINPSGTLAAAVTFAAPGITISANSPMGIQIDVNPNQAITTALGVNFGLGVTAKTMAMKPAGEVEDLEDLQGTVQNLNLTSSQFTLHTMHGDFTILINNNTEFELESCGGNNLSCLLNGEVVTVDAMVMSAGAFVAKKIEAEVEDEVEDDELDGIIFKIDDATHFEMVVLDELRSVNNVNLGNPVVVTLNNATFRVQTDNLPAPGTLLASFESATNTAQLIPGQTVQVRVAAPVNSGPPFMVTSDRVRLVMTQFTANVMTGSIAPPNFSVNNLPALFGTTGIASIHVQTSSQTEFDGVASVSALANGDTVSLRGLLFRNGANPPELIAKKVRRRND
jgi:Domain of unknown function (DUF5666)